MPKKVHDKLASPETELKHKTVKTIQVLLETFNHLGYTYRNIFNLEQSMPIDKMKQARDEIAQTRMTLMELVHKLEDNLS